jgi:branched-chain amino acid transport system substrate-binding protein
MRTVHLGRVGFVAVLVTALVAAACGGDNSSKSSASTTSPSGASTTAGGATTMAGGATTTTGGGTGTTAAGGVDLDAEAAKFFAPSSGAADQSKKPITFGYVNQEGGVPSFPEATLGAEAAINYVNTRLGGVDGHPLKIVKCVVQTEEDGQKCGTQMLNNPDIQAVMVGMLVVGGQSLYGVLNGQKPVLILNPLTQADYSAKNAYAFSGGVAAGYTAFGKFIGGDYLSPKPKSLAIVTTNNPAGIAAINGLVVPTLKQLGLTDIRIAQVSDTATGPDVVSAVQAAKADTADAVMISLQTSGCIAAYDALKSLNITKPVITTNLCYAKPVAEHLNGSFPEGWNFAGLGFNPYMPADPNVPTSWVLPLNVREVASMAKGAEVDPTGPAIYTFGPVLTIAKILDGIGADKFNAQSLSAAMKSYKGPLLGTAGNADCGKNPAFPTVCGAAVGFQRYEKGAFVSVADGYNGKVVLAW